MDEIFLEDEETHLWVSNIGRVIGPMGLLKPTPNDNGYLLVGVSSKTRRKKQRQERVHRIVARTFLPNPKNLPFVNHKDENPANNRVDNLEWCDCKYNNNYGTSRKRILATMKRNGNFHCITLTNGVDVRTFESYADAARFLGVTVSNFGKVKQQKTASVKGWYLPTKDGMPLPSWTERQIATRRQRGYANGGVPVTLEKDGKIVTFPSYGEAARVIGTKATNVWLVATRYKDNIRSVKGWHRPGESVGVRKTKPIAIEKSGVIKNFSSLKEAESFLGVLPGGVSRLASGKQKTVKGWRLASPEEFPI